MSLKQKFKLLKQIKIVRSLDYCDQYIIAKIKTFDFGFNFG